MTSKPFVHELKAHGFDLMWAPLDIFPRDGHTVVVECSDGVERKALWDYRRDEIAIELPEAVTPLRWKEC